MTEYIIILGYQKLALKAKMETKYTKYTKYINIQNMQNIYNMNYGNLIYNKMKIEMFDLFRNLRKNRKARMYLGIFSVCCIIN